jgi:catechol 2,3-dioxygenase
MNPYHSNNVSHIDSIGIRVKDIVKSSNFYQNLLHLDIIEQNELKIVLGSNGKPLLTLIEASDKKKSLEEGLYHVAFLLPDFPTLGAWLKNTLNVGIQLSGASDHHVSKAIYLNDPDGNGIEVYADTNPDLWVYTHNRIKMITAPLNIDNLLDNSNDVEYYNPVIGHVHLASKDNKKMAKFYSNIGMNTMLDMGSAIFMAYGNYHHHLGINNWNMKKASLYQKASINIDFINIHSTALNNQQLIDPIGIKVNII